MARAKITQLGTKRYWIKKSWEDKGYDKDGFFLGHYEAYRLYTWTQTPGKVIGTTESECFKTKKEAQANLKEIVKAYEEQHGN